MKYFLSDFPQIISGLSTVFMSIFFVIMAHLFNARAEKERGTLDNQIEKIADLIHSSEMEVETVELLETQKIQLSELEISNNSELIDRIDKQNQAIHKLQNELGKLKSEITQKKNTWSLVEGLIENYHKQALRQASIQFWFSAVAAIIGLLFIIISLFLSESLNVYEKIVGTLPGVTIDLIAALFFKQAEQTRQRATELYDRLRLDKEREEAIKLIESIDDPLLKSIVKAQLALKIGGVDASLNDLSSILRKELTKTT
ncbi:TRADD-N-associated membrane domain-containing protein [Paenibacillus tundrae]|uniref:Succinate dehydrogenase hydrophobic anchor subunit n=1 Tax=Paenibacillus tundrae TaxID=528187 RepID=A0ABT9W7E2_9BACL|nr:hypothetical protein [Paenibacillus tundrae]MDQ0169167.1 succinate dehydrogenase hydrophobic anchor subunit [Paenibacillus tundrae]